MPKKAVYLFVFPGFADWEAAHAVAELRRQGGYRVEVVALSMNPVESMGGIMVQPSRTIADIDRNDVAVFILPGGDRWEQHPTEPDLIRVLTALDTKSIPIAAICAATTAVVRAGLLRGRRHTSNGLKYLQQQVPDYKEAASYVDAPAVRDDGLITASGLSAVEFAREIMAELDVLSEDDRERWAKLFRGGRIPEGAA
ncbi:MAG TPA: DJ-1/PfpI family protein [Pyrinomonadaceae bacterium]|nr:DJ-1/PfpI family protein [Pyrinomonadaceae bacterium]